jgi:uncharacterized membrane protein YfcA
VHLGAFGYLAAFAAGFAAGGINVVVGSGSLLTFPTLLGLGLPSLTANVTNTIGLVPGSVAGAVGYRAELKAMRGPLQALIGWALAGGLAGAVLLLELPSAVFDKVVPLLVLLAVALMAAQPRLAAYLAHRGRTPERAGFPLRVGVFAVSVYGGYFGAAQGVLLLGLLGLLLPVTLQQANGVKNVLGGSVNAISGLAFALTAHVDWFIALDLAVASSLGGVVGGRYGRRLPSTVLRRVVVAVGTVVGIILLVQHHG